MKGSSKRDQVCRSCSSTAPVPQDTVTIDIKRPAKKGFRQRDLEGVSFLAGLNLSPEPVQVLVGIRGNYGSILGGSVQLVPELNLGFGGSTTSWQLSLNGMIPLSTHRFEPIRPYLGAGLGVLAFTDVPEDLKGIQATLNLLCGAERDYRRGKLFVEYVNMNFFKFNRLHTGYRFKF